MYFLIELLRRIVYQLHQSKIKKFAGQMIWHGAKSRLKVVQKCADAVIKCHEGMQNYFKMGFNSKVLDGLDANGEKNANEKIICDQTFCNSLTIHEIKNITSYPKITIVTPNYNQGKFLEACIRSVVLQNYPNLEYIIIDGGSTDNSLAVIRKYEKKVTYWVSEKDKGQADAINKGLRRATGEIFNWLNSDDRLAPGALLRCAEAFLGNPCASGWVGACRRVNEKGDLDEVIFPNGLERENIGQNWNGRQFYQPSCFLSTKKVKDIGGLNPDLFIAMDLDLWLRILEKGRFVVGKGIWSEAITHEGAKTQRYTEKMMQETIDLQKKYGFIEGAEKRLKAFQKKHALEYTMPRSLKERYSKIRDSARAVRMMSWENTVLEKRKNLCFIANFDSKHDFDAILYFLRNIFPYILRRNWTELHIIGKNAKKHAWFRQHNVRFINAGADMEKLLKRYKLFVCPVISGEGKEKILIAASAGLPIVTTATGAKGLPLRDGEECFIAESPMEFAEKCNQCLLDSISWHNFSIKAKLMAVETFVHSRVSKRNSVGKCTDNVNYSEIMFDDREVRD